MGSRLADFLSKSPIFASFSSSEETKEEQAHRERLEKRMCDESAMWKHTQQPTLLEALAYSKVDPDAKQSKAYLNDLAGNLQISTSSKGEQSVRFVSTQGDFF